MKFWKVGEKGRAICEDCEKLVETTFGLHDLPMRERKVTVNAVMAASCDECGAVVAIPPMSTPVIREALAAHLAARLPDLSTR